MTPPQHTRTASHASDARPWRVALCVCVLLSAYASARAPHADASGAPRVRVKGSARVDAHASRERARVALSGSVLDDAGRPIPAARVTIGVTRAPDGAPATTAAPLALAVPDTCGGGAEARLERADRLVTSADETGRYCVRLELPAGRYVAHVEVPASPLVDGASADVAVDLSLAVTLVALRFDPARSTLSLDEPTALVDVVASSADEGVRAAAPGLPLALFGDSGALLGNAATDRSGRARFAVQSARLGPPGPGELRAAFAGEPGAAAAEARMAVERRTSVELSAVNAPEGRLAAGAPDEGAPLVVAAKARCAARGCSAVATGIVEVRSGDADDIVGAAPLDHGQARVVVTTAAVAAEPLPLRIRYVPDAPWFEPAGELTVLLPVRSASGWRKGLLALAAAAAVAWVALVRLPLGPFAPFARRRASAARAARPGVSRGDSGARVELVSGASGSGGWTGRVIDAHDGTAVGHASVSIERAGFERVDVVAQTTCDADGRFALPEAPVERGDELVLRGPLHETLRRPLPPAGELAVRLVTRKRALVDRLVAWARRRGPPFDAQPDASPGHVQRAAASDARAGQIARWARAVEAAAYDEGVVDEKGQAEVDALAPTDDVDGARPRSL